MEDEPKMKPSSAHYGPSGGPPPSSRRGFLSLGLLLFSVSLAITSWVSSYHQFQPPPPTICGTPNGPPVTAPRVELRDGRFLAYKEAGVPRENAKFKIIAVHGYGGSRHAMLGGLSEELLSELKVYVVGFDRAGYGQSTPLPHRTIQSDVYDVQDLADKLELGPTFFVVTTSIGGYTGWGLVKYIPHRLAGITMIAPVVNYWWSGLPSERVSDAFGKQKIGDRLALRVAHHAPGLIYWYMTQRWFPTSSTVKLQEDAMEDLDRLRISEGQTEEQTVHRLEATGQGKHESQFRDMTNMFGLWEFEPFEIENPFLNRTGAAHIWQGDDDYLVPVVLQREVVRALPWVKYHELPGAGHGLLHIPGQADLMIRTLLTE